MSPAQTGSTDLILRILGGPENNTLLPIKTESCTLAKQNQDQTKSECAVQRDEEGAIITRRNGDLRINGQLQNEQRLREGDRIEFGEKVYEVFKLGSFVATPQLKIESPAAQSPYVSESNVSAQPDESKKLDGRIEKLESELGKQSENFDAVNKKFDELSGQLSQLLNLVAGNSTETPTSNSGAQNAEQHVEQRVETDGDYVQPLTETSHNTIPTENEPVPAENELIPDDTEVETVEPLENDIVEQQIDYSESPAMKTEDDEPVDDNVQTYLSSMVSDESVENIESTESNVEMVGDSPVIPQNADEETVDSVDPEQDESAPVLEPASEQPSTDLLNTDLLYSTPQSPQAAAEYDQKLQSDDDGCESSSSVTESEVALEESLPQFPDHESTPSPLAQEIDREAAELERTDRFGEDASSLGSPLTEEVENDYEANILSRLDALTAQAKSEVNETDAESDTEVDPSSSNASFRPENQSPLTPELETNETENELVSDPSQIQESNLDRLLASLDAVQTNENAALENEFETSDELAEVAVVQTTEQASSTRSSSESANENDDPAKVSTEQPIDPQESKDKLNALFASLRQKDEQSEPEPSGLAENEAAHTETDSSMVNPTSPTADGIETQVPFASSGQAIESYSKEIGSSQLESDVELGIATQVEPISETELQPMEQDAGAAKQESVADVLARMNAMPDLDDDGTESTGQPETDSNIETNAVRPNEEFAAESVVNEEPKQEGSADVQDYMNSLMQRLNGGKSAPKTVQQDQPKAVDAVDETPDLESPAPVEPFNPQDYVPKQKAPELNSNLAAMRELANASTRSAVQTSERKKKKEDAYTMLIAAGGALIGAVATSFLSQQPGDTFSFVSIGLFLTTAVCSFLFAKSNFANLGLTPPGSNFTSGCIEKMTAMFAKKEATEPVSEEDN